MSNTYFNDILICVMHKPRESVQDNMYIHHGYLYLCIPTSSSKKKNLVLTVKCIYRYVSWKAYQEDYLRIVYKWSFFLPAGFLRGRCYYYHSHVSTNTWTLVLSLKEPVSRCKTQHLWLRPSHYICIRIIIFNRWHVCMLYRSTSGCRMESKKRE